MATTNGGGPAAQAHGQLVHVPVQGQQLSLCERTIAKARQLVAVPLYYVALVLHTAKDAIAVPIGYVAKAGQRAVDVLAVPAGYVKETALSIWARLPELTADQRRHLERALRLTLYLLLLFVASVLYRYVRSIYTVTVSSSVFCSLVGAILGDEARTSWCRLPNAVNDDFATAIGQEASQVVDELQTIGRGVSHTLLDAILFGVSLASGAAQLFARAVSDLLTEMSENAAQNVEHLFEFLGQGASLLQQAAIDFINKLLVGLSTGLTNVRTALSSPPEQGWFS